MVINFFGPFEQIAGKELKIELAKSISVQALIQRLVLKYPDLVPYANKKNDIELYAHMMLIRKGQPLKLVDKIENEDCISILLPVTGG